MCLLICLLATAVALTAGQNTAPVVDVIVPPLNSQSIHRTLGHAEGIAAEIFSQIGVQIRWRWGRSQSRGRRTILVAFSWNTPANFHPGAMAVSYPYAVDGAEITVFMDRLEPMRGSNPTTGAALLGHVLAHEMGHVLQRTEHHSACGVLKARWSQAEIRNMASKPLHFANDDARRIRDGIRGE